MPAAPERGSTNRQPRRSSRRSSSRRSKPRNGSPFVLAPKPTGVFASPRPQAPDPGDTRPQRRRQRRAEERLPGNTVPVRVFPSLRRPSRRQAQAIVSGQRRALRGTTFAERERALDVGDRQTRQQLGIAADAQRALIAERRVSQGRAVQRAEPRDMSVSRRAPGTDVALLADVLVAGGARRRKGEAATELVGRLTPEEIRRFAERAQRRGRAVGRADALRLGTALELGRSPDTVRAKRDRRARVLGLATIDTGHLGRTVAARLNAGTGGFEPGGFLLSGAQDALHLPYDAVRSIAEFGRAGVDLAHGDTRRAGAIAKGFAEGVIGHAVRGDWQGVVRVLEEHPLYAALELSGAYSAVGRGLGAGVRGAAGLSRRAAPESALAGRLAAAGSLRRPDLVVGGGKASRVRRSYSKNIITAAVQRSNDRGLARRGNVTRDGGIVPREGLVAPRLGRRSKVTGERELNITSPRRRAVGRAVDEFTSTLQDVGRMERETTRGAGAHAVGGRRSTREVRQAQHRARVVAAIERAGVARRRRGESPDDFAMRVGPRAFADLAQRAGMKLSRTRRARLMESVRELGRQARPERLLPTRIGVGRASRYLRPERDLVVAVAEGRLGKAAAGLHGALRREIDRLEAVYEAEHRNLSLAQRQNNRRAVGAMVAMAKDLEAGGKRGARAQVRAERLFEHAERYSRVARRISRDLVRAGVLTQEQADAAALRPHAVAVQGLRFDHTKAPTDADQAAFEAGRARVERAHEHVRAAEKAHKAAVRELARVQGGAQVRRGQTRAAVVKPGEASGATRAERVLSYIDRAEQLGPEVLGRLAQKQAETTRAVERATEAVRRAELARRLARKELHAATSEAPGAPRAFVRGLVEGDPAVHRAAQRAAADAARDGREIAQAAVETRGELEQAVKRLGEMEADARETAAMARGALTGGAPARAPKFSPAEIEGQRRLVAALEDHVQALESAAENAASDLAAARAAVEATVPRKVTLDEIRARYQDEFGGAPPTRTHDLTGRPDLPVSEARWFHGTQGSHDRVTVDHGGAADLGAFFTSDPKLAARYTSDEVHGGRGEPRLLEARIDPKRTLDIRLGTEDRGALAQVADVLLERARALENDYLDGRLSAPADAAPMRTVKILESFKEGLSSARSIEEWKANEAKLYDAAMRISRAEGDKGHGFGSERPLREALLSLGFDSIRKGDDGADTLVALTDKILEPAGMHSPAEAARLVGDVSGRREAPLPAFVSHRPEAHGSSAFFVNWLSRSLSRKTADPHRRTGESTRLGAHASDEAAAIESLVHAQGVLSAARNWDRFVGAFGVTRPDGRPFTWKEAEEFARATRELENAGIPSAEHLVPVRIAPARYGDARLEEILSGLQRPNAAEAPRGLISERLEAALSELRTDAHDGARNVVLVPSAALRRFNDHQGGTTSDIARLGQAWTNVFRSTVLPTSLKWLTGNVAEAFLRSAMWGITPIDVAFGRRVLRDMIQGDEEWGKLLVARTQGGLLYGTASRLSVHRDAAMFADSALEGPAGLAGLARTAPVVKQVLDGYMAFAHTVFSLNKWLEQQFQAGVVGKQMRAEIQEARGWTSSWGAAVGLQRRAYADALMGLSNTPAQARFARAVDTILGKYSRFSPLTRRVIQSVAPFLPWYLNAVRFVYHSLPHHHPIKTALLVRTEATLDTDARRDAEGRPPGQMGAAVALEDGGLLDLARYSPFGAFTPLGRGFEKPEALTEPLLPQWTTALDLLRFGIDFTGRPVELSSGQKKPTGLGRLGLAIYSGVETFFPLVQIIRRAQEGGATPFADSTVFAPKTKPGTAHASPLDVPGLPAALNRILNPVRPVYLRKPGGKGIALPREVREALADPRVKEQLRQATQGLDPVQKALIEQQLRDAGVRP